MSCSTACIWTDSSSWVAGYESKKTWFIFLKMSNIFFKIIFRRRCLWVKSHCVESYKFSIGEADDLVL